ncbi:MAG: hypothetical protein Q8Q47_01920, partial [Ignavibacteriaceae bacterium]|nr:hypothetical protein [Ignavibacteriaceae bacterium]
MKKLLQTLFFFLLIVQAGYTQWARQNPVPPVNGFLCVEFISESTGFAAGDEAMMLKTTDGGASWEIKDLGYYCYLVDIEFINENT